MMHCNKCGKPNSDKSRFCVYCGNELEQKVISEAEYNIENKQKYRNGLILSVVTCVLIVICVFNIVNILSGVVRVTPYNEQAIANNTYVYETKGYYYYYYNGIVRFDKKNNNTVNITNEYANIIAADRENIYFTNNNGIIYKIKDGEIEPEEMQDPPFDVNNALFNVFDGAVEYLIYDKFSYVVYNNGAIVKQINSAKNKHISQMIYEGDNSNSLIQSCIYKGYMYLFVEWTPNGQQSDGFRQTRLLRVSLSTGKEEVVLNKTIDSFKFCENNIVYYDHENDFNIVDLDGQNEKKIIDDLYGKNISYICSGSNVFFSVYDEDEQDKNKRESYYKYSIKDNIITSKSTTYASFAELSDGFAEIKNNSLILYDENGNIKST